jgi:hypothetical protein
MQRNALPASSVAAGAIAWRCCDGCGQLSSVCMQPSTILLHQETDCFLLLSFFAPKNATKKSKDE